MIPSETCFGKTNKKFGTFKVPNFLFVTFYFLRHVLDDRIAELGTLDLLCAIH